MFLVYFFIGVSFWQRWFMLQTYSLSESKSYISYKHDLQQKHFEKYIMRLRLWIKHDAFVTIPISTPPLQFLYMERTGMFPVSNLILTSEETIVENLSATRLLLKLRLFSQHFEKLSSKGFLSISLNTLIQILQFQYKPNHLT